MRGCEKRRKGEKQVDIIKKQHFEECRGMISGRYITELQYSIGHVYMHIHIHIPASRRGPRLTAASLS